MRIKLTSIFSTVALALSIGLPVRADKWVPSETFPFEYKIGKRDGDWYGLRFDLTSVSLELVNVVELLNADGSSKGGIRTGEGRATFLRYSLEDLWAEVSEDPRVIAAIPIGYAERANVPDLAGLIIQSGEPRSPIMMARTLTALACINSLDSLRPPFYLPISYDPGQAYGYLPFGDLSVVDNTEGLLTSCVDGIQIGPRLLEPEQGSQSIQPSRSSEIDVEDGRNSLFRRLIMVRDASNRLSFAVFDQPVMLNTVFTSISKGSDALLTCQSEMGDCSEMALVATSYEHVGIYFRPNSDSINATFYGNTKAPIPAAIVIRRK